MNLEPIIQSELGQKEKYNIASWHIYVNLERWYWWIYLQGSSGEKDIENRPMDTARRQERVRCKESNMEIYITICKTASQWEFAVWLRELKQGFCDNLEGWGGEGDGREVWEGGDMGVPKVDSYWCLTTKFCKAVILRLRINKFLKICPLVVIDPKCTYLS